MRFRRLALFLLASSGGCGETAPDVTTRQPLDVEIRLERSECYGSCPNYEVVIDGSGLVTYQGRSFVPEIGVRTSRIPRRDVEILLARFADIGFFELQDHYRQWVTDLSTTWLTLRVGDKRKRVSNYWRKQGKLDPRGEEIRDWEVHHGLDQIAEAIDAVVHVDAWIGTEDERRDLRGTWGATGHPGSTKVR